MFRPPPPKVGEVSRLEGAETEGAGAGPGPDREIFVVGQFAPSVLALLGQLPRLRRGSTLLVGLPLRRFLQ